MKVALVHEHLAQDGGAERVLKVFHEIFPDAPIFTLVYERDKANKAFADADVRTSFINRMPGGLRFYQAYLPLMPTAVEKYNLSEFDVVLSSASAFAKGVVTDPRTVHICYCHSPTRYLWNDTHQYYKELRYNRYIKRLIPLLFTPLRVWDKAAADRVDHFIANSKYVRRRISKYYKAGSDIIYPPVEVDKFYVADQPGDYFLMLGRLVAYKRFDLAIKTFNRLGLPLKVVGNGPEYKYLRRIAGENIEFLGRVSDKERVDLFAKCKAFINPQEEDFGITAVEAQASGRPVIAYQRGGNLETVIEGKTGIFFDEQSEDSLRQAILRFHKTQFDPRFIRTHAEGFSEDRFKREIKNYVETAYAEYNKSYDHNSPSWNSTTT